MNLDHVITRAAALALFCAVVPACGGGADDKGSAKSAAPTSAPPAAASTAKAAATQAEAPAAAAKPADKGGGPAEMPAGQSPVPTAAEWNAVQGEVTVRGSSALGCETKGLREWIRVSCRGDDPGRGSPLNVTVENGKGAETFKFASGGVTSLVYRFVEGTKVEATFSWTRYGKRFVAEWPPGAPKPQAFGEFR